MAARLRAPGLARGGLFVVIGVLVAAVIVTLARAAYGFSNPFDGADGWDVKFQDAVLTVGLISSGLFFLVGIGGFDYWFYWASGRPTRPEDHSAHGAKTWKDYFRVNTDHKVIGIQYVCTSFFFMLVGAPPVASPLPGSCFSSCTASPRSPRTSSAFQSTRSRVLDTTYFFAASIVRPKGAVQSGIPSIPGGRQADSIISYVTRPKRRASACSRNFVA